MPIQTLLDVPAEAISPRDIELLGKYPAKDRPFGMALIAYPHGEGWTVSTSQMHNPSESDRAGFVAHARSEGFSEGFVELLSRATERGASLLRVGQHGVASEAVTKLLDVSTGHVTLKDSHLLEKFPSATKASDAPGFAHPYEYGWTVSTTGVSGPGRDRFVEGLRAAGFSDGFVALLDHAHAQGAAMVRLDQDGDMEPGLMAFDWDRDDAPYDPELYGDSQEAEAAQASGPAR